MSVTEYSGERDETRWEEYLSYLRVLSMDNGGVRLTPSYRDYLIWLDDQDIELGEAE
jgi:hypothetical protein